MSRNYRYVLLLPVLITTLCVDLQAQTETTDQQFWPAVKLNLDLTPRVRVQLTSERHDEEGDKRISTRYAAFLNYRIQRFLSHLTLIDSDEQYYLTMSIGYEYIAPGGENRLVVAGTPRYEPGLGILITDRNRIEFRWLDQGYDFRYRNKLSAKRNFKISRVRFSPYASGEVYWDRKYHSFNENAFAFGVELPVQQWLMVDTYYQRQNCNTCSKEKVNILGVSLNLFFGRKKK